MKRIALLLNIFVILGFTLNAQDVFFAQMDKSPLLMNPANTGFFNGSNRLGVNYRNQWKSITTPFTTTAAFYDIQLLKQEKEDRLGLGLVFFSDKSGDVDLGLTQVSLSMAYEKLLTKENLFMFGFQAGYAKRSFNFLKAKWDNQYVNNTYNPQILSGEANSNSDYSYIDYAAGLAWSFRPNDNLKSTTGLACFHLSGPKSFFFGTSREGLYRKIVAHNKTEIALDGSPFSFEPAVSYIRQGADQQIMGGLMVRFTEGGGSFYNSSPTPTVFSLGGYYRTQSAIVFAARLNYSLFEYFESWKDFKKWGFRNFSFIYCQILKKERKQKRCSWFLRLKN
jgi:type IX secretion system PorP/SprF family membrane protein